MKWKLRVYVQLPTSRVSEKKIGYLFADDTEARRDALYR